MYRKQLEDYAYTKDELENNEYYIEESEVKGILDNIETRVNKIEEILNPIKGLTEIDEAKDLLVSLSKDLY